MTSFVRLACLTLACSLAISAPPAFGQTTRDEALAAEQAAKAMDLHPYVPDKTERRIERASRFLTATPTVYTFIGSIYPGGLLALGPGVRGRYAGTGAVDLHGAWSLKNFKSIDGTMWLPDMAGRRLRVGGRANWIDAPSVASYPAGNTSLRDDRTTFSYRTATAGATGRFQATRAAAVGGSLDVIDFDTERAGFFDSPRYTRSQAFAEFDWRDSPGYTARGGWYRIDWSNYDQHNGGSGSFRRLDAEADQFVPLLRANWVLAFRALATITDTEGTDAVPYFLLPELGGSRTLRGYPSWRFRDRNRLLLTGEYRWTAGQFVDMALFFDAGKVTAERSDLDLSGLHTGYGIGVRFHTPAATALRVELAHSVEGTGLIFAFGPSF